MKKLYTPLIILFITSFCFCQDKGGIENPILSIRGSDLFLEKRATQIINELPQVNPDFISSQKKNTKLVMQINFKIVK